MDDRTQPPLTQRTILAQALGAGDTTTGALVPPIHMSATYLRDPDNGIRADTFMAGRTTRQFSSPRRSWLPLRVPKPP